MKSRTKPAKLHPFRGDMRTVEEIAFALGLSKRAVYLRIERGIPVEEELARGPIPGSKMKPRKKPGTKMAVKRKATTKAPLPKQPKQTVVREETIKARPIIRFMPQVINRQTDLSALFSHG